VDGETPEEQQVAPEEATDNYFPEETYHARVEDEEFPEDNDQFATIDSNHVAKEPTQAPITTAEPTCFTYNNVFPTNNQLHIRLRKTGHRIPKNSTASAFFTSHDTTSLPSQYVTVMATLKSDGVLELVCLDSGNPVTLIDRQFLRRQGYEGTPEPSNLWIKGVGEALTKAEGRVKLQLFLPEQNGSSTITIDCKAHILPFLRPNMLVGTDILHEAGFMLDFQTRTASVGSRTLNMSVTTNASRDSRAPEEVFAAKTTVLLPSVFTPLAIRTAGTKPRSSSSIFIPNQVNFLTQMVDSNSNSVYAYNASNIPSTVATGKLLGTLDEATGICIQSLPRSQWMKAITTALLNQTRL